MSFSINSKSPNQNRSNLNQSNLKNNTLNLNKQYSRRDSVCFTGKDKLVLEGLTAIEEGSKGLSLTETFKKVEKTFKSFIHRKSSTNLKPKTKEIAPIKKPITPFLKVSSNDGESIEIDDFNGAVYPGAKSNAIAKIKGWESTYPEKTKSFEAMIDEINSLPVRVPYSESYKGELPELKHDFHPHKAHLAFNTHFSGIDTDNGIHSTDISQESSSLDDFMKRNKANSTQMDTPTTDLDQEPSSLDDFMRRNKANFTQMDTSTTDLDQESGPIYNLTRRDEFNSDSDYMDGPNIDSDFIRRDSSHFVDYENIDTDQSDLRNIFEENDRTHCNFSGRDFDEFSQDDNLLHTRNMHNPLGYFTTTEPQDLDIYSQFQ